MCLPVKFLRTKDGKEECVCVKLEKLEGKEGNVNASEGQVRKNDAPGGLTHAQTLNYLYVFCFYTHEHT